MSDKRETETEYLKRKALEVSELINTAIDHPDIISGIRITDGVATNPQAGSKIPLVMIAFDIKESFLNKLKEKK